MITIAACQYSGLADDMDLKIQESKIFIVAIIIVMLTQHHYVPDTNAPVPSRGQQQSKMVSKISRSQDIIEISGFHRDF